MERERRMKRRREERREGTSRGSDDQRGQQRAGEVKTQIKHVILMRSLRLHADSALKEKL